MKTATYWWGQEILAETEIEEHLLKELFAMTGVCQNYTYEDGGIGLVTVEVKTHNS